MVNGVSVFDYHLCLTIEKGKQWIARKVIFKEIKIIQFQNFKVGSQVIDKCVRFLTEPFITK